MDWSGEQDKALKAVDAWLKEPGGPQVFRLFGYAGTGKSTIAKHFGENVDGDVVFCAFTGKAALVMRNKGCKGARTIHSTIYNFDEVDLGQPKFVLNEDSDVADAELAIVDECSMVNEELGHDLLSFGTKILVLGGPFQLPPVEGNGFFTEVEKPDFMLTEVHRQARENPIIQMSMDIRSGSLLKPGKYGGSRIITRKSLTADDVLQADQLLVGKNATRQAFNARYRTIKGFDQASPWPIKGERLICLRNDREKHLLNGGMWDVLKRSKEPLTDGTLKIVVNPEDADDEKSAREVRVFPEFFEGRESELDWEDKRGTQEFTFGYAVTVHKAQGSQWNDICLFDESRVFGKDRRRWLYTGITRAAERVTMVQ